MPERAGRSDRANDWHRAGARQNRLAEPGLQHSPLGDAGTARRDMKWSPSAVSNEAAGGKTEAVKTANQIENRDLNRTCTQSGVKSTIVRGALSLKTTPGDYRPLSFPSLRANDSVNRAGL